MKNLEEPDLDIEIHVTFTRQEVETLISDLNHYGLADVTVELILLLKRKIA